MISVGDACLTLGVDTRPLDKGLQGIGAKLKKHRKAIGLGMAAMGGTILAAGVLSLKTFAEMGDEVHKMSLRTGFATETLSRFKYAAEIGGATLGDVERAVKKMSMSISDAKDGLATYTREFEKIGIEVSELEGLKPEEQFLKLAMAVAAIEDPIQRASSAQKIFGRAGTALLPMLADGEEGLRAVMAEAEKFAPIFDEQAAVAAAKLTDTMGQLEGSMSKTKMEIAERLVPILIPLIEKIRDIIVGISDWMKEHPQLTKLIVIGTTALGLLLVVLGSLLLLLPGLVIALHGLGGAFTLALGPVGLIIAGIAALIAIGVLVWKNWDVIKAKTIEIWTKIVDTLKHVWWTITNIFRENWRKILAILFPAVGLPILIAKNWGRIVEKITQIFNDVRDVVWAWWRSFTTWLTSLSPWESLKNRFGDLIIKIPAVFLELWYALKQWWTDVKGWLGSLVPWDFLKDAWGDLIVRIAGIWSDIYGGLTSWWADVKAFLKSLNPWEWMKAAWQDIVSGIKSVLRSIFGGSLMEKWVSDLKSWLAAQSFGDESRAAFGTILASAEEELNKTGALTKEKFDEIKDYLETLILPYPEVGPPPEIPAPTPPPYVIPEPTPPEEWSEEKQKAYEEYLEDKAAINEKYSKKLAKLKDKYKAGDLDKETYNKLKHALVQQREREREDLARAFEAEWGSFKKGGIITRRTLALLGEGGVKEAVIPLDRLERMLGGGAYRTANIYIILDERVLAEALEQRLVDDMRLRTGSRI